MDFLKDIVKEIGDDFTKLASEINEVEQYVDTGSYIFNGLCSGSCLLYTSPSPRDRTRSRMPSSA